ncbi:MAG: hypothetical protein ACREEA_08375, partial [Stellaceae bacterium]
MKVSIRTFAKYSVAAVALLALTDGVALAQTLPNSPSNTGTAQEGPGTTWNQNANYANTGTLGIGGNQASPTTGTIGSGVTVTNDGTGAPGNPGIINNEAGSTVTNNGTISGVNHSTLTNDGSATLGGVTTPGHAIIDNAGTITTDGSSTLNNVVGTPATGVSSEITNTGSLTNSGILTNNAKGNLGATSAVGQGAVLT